MQKISQGKLISKKCVTIGVLSMNDDIECEKDYSKIQVHTKYE